MSVLTTPDAKPRLRDVTDGIDAGGDEACADPHAALMLMNMNIVQDLAARDRESEDNVGIFGEYREPHDGIAPS